jgi:hypothetical protein
MIPALTASIAALGLAGPATELARYDAQTPLAANHGTVAWSAYDPGTREFRLTVYRRGAMRQVPVPPRAVPFDADVGLGPGGRPMLVYSRCRRESYDPDTGLARTRDCDLRAFDLTSDRERAIPAGDGPTDDSEPIVSGNRVVFSRGGRVYTAPVQGGRARRVRIRGDGPIFEWDLLGRRVALTMGATIEGADTVEVRLQKLDGTRSRVVLRRSVGTSGRHFVGLGFDRGRLGFAMVCEIECRSGRAFRHFGGRLESARVPVTLDDFALARGQAFWVNSPGDTVKSIIVRRGRLRFR